LCEKSGAIALVLLGLTVGRQAGRQAGWLADEIRSAKFKFFKNYIPYDKKFWREKFLVK